MWSRSLSLLLQWWWCLEEKVSFIFVFLFFISYDITFICKCHDLSWHRVCCSCSVLFVLLIEFYWSLLALNLRSVSWLLLYHSSFSLLCSFGDAVCVYHDYNCIVEMLPNRTLLMGVHVGSKRAVEALREFLDITHRSNYSEHRRWMWTDHDPQLEYFRSIFATPDIGSRDPE